MYIFRKIRYRHVGVACEPAHVDIVELGGEVGVEHASHVEIRRALRLLRENVLGSESDRVVHTAVRYPVDRSRIVRMVAVKSITVYNNSS